MKSPGPDSYQQWEIDFVDLRPVWSQQSAHKIFLRDLPARGGRLLDIGCGVGDFCEMAHQAGYSVTGIDFTPHFIEAARRRFPSLDFETMTVEEFVSRRPQDRYDIITFIQVLEHLDNLPTFINAAKKSLKPGGYLVCAVPNRDRWRFFSRQFREAWDYPPNHLTWWDRDSLERLFSSFGFTDINVKIDPLSPFDCSFLVTEKLGFARLAEWLGRKLISARKTEEPSSEAKTEAKRNSILQMGYRFYVRFIPVFFGIITLPVLPVLRKRGNSLYLLARLKE